MSTLTGLAVVLAGCGLAMHGAVQTIPLASEPPGAEVLVDGVFQGHTSLEVTLSRGQSHTVEFRLAGRESRTVVIQNVVDPASVGLDLLVGGPFTAAVLLLPAGVSAFACVISLGQTGCENIPSPAQLNLLLILGVVTPVIVDAATRAVSNLQPGDVVVTLPPAAESPVPEATP
ncbi:MAG: PEGA domain-containing protein [Deinococcus sp.]|nr:PEGA domain-containing protein [Deinococcus sp.]